MTRIIILFSALLLSGLITSGQTILLQQDVNKDTVPATKGPNLNHFRHWYLAYGFVLGNPEGNGGDIKMGSSSQFSFGLRYKRRVGNFYAFGFDLSYNITSFHLVQDTMKVIPNNAIHYKEALRFNNIALQFYNRFNFGKRGNYVGKYLDLGGYGEWTFSVTHFTKDKHAVANASGASITETYNRRLTFVNAFNYGAAARIGINRFALYGKYRLSNLFKKAFVVDGVPVNSIYPELPRIVVGLEIGLFSAN